MSREWVDAAKLPPRRGPDTRDRRWVMRCDVGELGPGPRCPTESEPQRREPDLDIFIVEGWFIADSHGDVCPVCLAAGVKPWNPGGRRWLTWNNLPHPITEETPCLTSSRPTTPSSASSTTASSPSCAG